MKLGRLIAKLAGASLLTLCAMVLLVGTDLRETPIFWHNAGGYPVALRNLIQTFFYPVYITYAASLLVASFVVARRLLARRWPGLILAVTCALNWLLFVTITTWVVWNNVDNLINGRPLHYHPPMPY